MAETLISPGVLARENDQSQITSQPIQAGAAIVGPTVKGQVNIPKLITTYSEYQACFGTTFDSGSDEFTFLTSISAYNYFQNGGTSLIVTRVASGSFTEATSSRIFNDVESGELPDGTNVLGQASNPGTDGAVGTFDNVATATSGDGTTVTANVVRSSGSGKLILSDTLNVTTPVAGGAAATYTDVALTGGTAGTGAKATIVLSDPTTIDSVTVTTTGSGYVDGETITIPSASLGASAGAGTDPVITLAAADLAVETTALTISGSGTGYAVGDTITIAAGVIGSPSSGITITLVDANITDDNAFTLETIGMGEIMNSAGAENSQGALTNGTTDNLRWEIASPNTSSGTFSVIIRQGNDTTRAKSVLESFNNVSLDPKSPNYISRIIGDQKQVVRGSGTDVYLQTSGSYANASRYVRVSSVKAKTPDYLDNSGTAKSAFTASIPIAGSGSFGDAQGSILTGTGKYYENISAADTQGLKEGNYTTAFNILANKDDFKYNIISAPGLYQSGYTSVLNTLISNTENRGDNIVVLDLEPYASSITAITSTAASLDTSYAAAYWPWCMVTDPDSGQRVWVPASTLLPGVYANNDRTAEAWFAPAGINRGGLGTVVQAERKLTQANRDTLYVGKVNPS